MSESEPLWYAAKAQAWSGPLGKDEIIRLLLSGELSFVDFVWRGDPGTGWIRIFEHPEFAGFLPGLPPKSFLQEIVRRDFSKMADRPSVATPRSDRGEITLNFDGVEKLRLDGSRGAPASKLGIWYLQFDGSEFGPLTLLEVEVILKGDKLKGNLFAWREGLEQWTAVTEVGELQPFLNKLGIGENVEELREHRRVPMIAMVRFSAGSPGAGEPAVAATSAGTALANAGSKGFLGVCRDVSLRGMLIYSNQNPGPLGSALHLEVSPMGDSAALPFTVEAEVTRVLPLQKGFSVRFRSLNPRTKAAIERHVEK